MKKKKIKYLPLVGLALSLLMTSAFPAGLWSSQPMIKNISVPGRTNAESLRFEYFGDYINEVSVAS